MGKRFDGKWYEYYEGISHDNNKIAVAHYLDGLRKHGYIRIVETKQGIKVYYRPKDIEKQKEFDAHWDKYGPFHHNRWKH